MSTMRLVFVSLLSLVLLVSCTTGQSSETNTAQDIQYPTSQEDTPATKFCVDKGGEVLIEKENDIELAYCLIDGEKSDAWKFMSDETMEELEEGENTQSE